MNRLFRLGEHAHVVHRTPSVVTVPRNAWAVRGHIPLAILKFRPQLSKPPQFTGNVFPANPSCIANFTFCHFPIFTMSHDH